MDSRFVTNDSMSGTTAFFLQEVLTADKGRGVIADRSFKKGDFLCCYKGDLLSKTEGKRRMHEYEEKLGSYIFFFQTQWK